MKAQGAVVCPQSVRSLALPSQVVDKGPPAPFSVTSVSSSLRGTCEDAICEILHTRSRTYSYYFSIICIYRTEERRDQVVDVP